MPGAEPEPSLVVLDASIAVRWLIDEEGSTEARELLHDEIEWIAPRLLLAEIAGALHRKVAAGEISQDQAHLALEGVTGAVEGDEIRLALDEQLVEPALRLAFLLGHKVPDCLYLALAEAEGATLATADRRLAALAKARGVPVRAVPSA